jgi:hypothetical protein
MRVLAMVIVLFASGLGAANLRAQGHVAGGAGVSAGTGGPAPAVAVSAGVEPSPHLGLALELSVTPRLDFGTRVIGPLPASGFNLQPSFPAMTITSTGTLTTVQVNVIVPLTTGKIRVSAVAGGGTASVRSRVHLHRDAFTFPGISIPGLTDVPGLTLPAEDSTNSGTATGLALNAGGVVHYAINPKTGIGLDLRYLHTSASSIDMFRAMGHVIWRF